MEIKVEEATEEKLEELGVKSWPIWEKEVSEFDWHYDQQEVCYLLTGEVTVTT
ncbi:MAG: cupin domain-containing protein, partial [Bacillota bacterium]